MLPEMRKACIAYLGMGGEFTNGPVSLLSGLRPYPGYLMFHFFAVALFGVCRVLLPFPTPRKIINAYRLLSAASNIVVPLVRYELHYFISFAILTFFILGVRKCFPFCQYCADYCF